MNGAKPLVVFTLDGQRYGLPLPCVKRSIRVVAITPLPSAPDVVLGVVDLAGTVIPVIDIRKRFSHPARAVAPSDQLLIASTGRRTVALLVDETKGVVEPAAESLAPAEGILPRLDLLDGALRLPDGLVLIHNLDRLLSLEEDAAIDQAMTSSNGRARP